ncbi:methionine/alanine import family NSS transporter small subunit [Nakamurella sp. YIM 132084]|uniref:Methionine/alanine import family NSS transporter small subunit n=1 Tax=Nakamurella leprariae TaxID=2803911 RepID=A0A939BW60_9ACTN|nr:methionine/alanine import family NSS transporter small subunit [Nakamurella leprariae]
MRRRAEGLGWWQVGICFVIAVYYAAVIAWAARYTVFSFDQTWGADPERFFFDEFLQAGEVQVTADVVPGVLVPLLLVWLAVLVIMALGVQRGIGATSVVFIPVLVLAFAALVVQALLLPGAAAGLDALFTPDWSALASASVWAAAFGQIFFSLSIGFGIMITYASYVGRREDMTGSGLVVGFSNSGFELLAGIGVFAALGFMAQANGVAVGEVAGDGIGLAFVAFPAIISEAPAGALLGVLFFGSLVIAGITSLVSVLEVVISAVRDKLDAGRLTATLAVGVPAALISLILFSTTSGIHVLDVVDHFVNQYGILVVALVSMVIVAWVIRDLTGLGNHLNVHGRPRVGTGWRVLTSVVAPVALTVVLVFALRDDLSAPYGGLPGVAVAELRVAPGGGPAADRLRHRPAAVARRDPPGRAAAWFGPGCPAPGPPGGRPPSRAGLGDRARRGRTAMSTSAIVMMVIAMIVIWGGLGLAIASLVRHGAVEDRGEEARTDR